MPDWAIGEWVVVCVALFVAGLVKGAIGFGLPLVAISLLGFVLAPREALALMPLPILLSNVLIFVRYGNFRDDIRLHRFVFPGVLAGALVGTLVIGAISEANLLLVLGASIAVFALFELSNRPIVIPRRLHPVAGLTAGSISGVFGTLTTMYGPPLIVYLLGTGTPKERYLGSVGLLWSFSAIVMIVAFMKTQIFTSAMIAPSLVALILAQAGITAGRWLSLRLNQSVFRRLVAVGLFCIGVIYVFRSLPVVI